MTDRTELKRLAYAAPSGPWLAENDSLYFKDDGYTRHMLDADSGMDVEEDKYCAALAFIAAANPATVLTLLAEIERLEVVAQHEIEIATERAKEVCGARMTLHALTAERDQLKAENAGLRTGYAAYEQVNAGLKAESEELRKTLGGLLALYEDDEGCRKLPEYIAARAAMAKEAPNA